MLHARKDYSPIQDPRNLIPDDEPVFLLRGRDKHAPETLRFYARLVENDTKGDVCIVRNTRCHARTMEHWQEDNEKKAPDMNLEDSVY
jgi:hypothetical protein